MAFKTTRSSRRLRNAHQHENSGSEEKAFFQPPAVQPKEAGAFFQPKLKIGRPDDRYEREADAVASRIVDDQGKGSDIQGRAPAIQTMSDSKIEEDRDVQEKADNRIQRAGVEEEEPMQAQGMEEEEAVQTQGMEEEETLQTQSMEEEEAVQTQGMEEEEPMQMQEEEEEPMQMQEEEELQTKSVARPPRPSAKLGVQLRNRSGKGRALDAGAKRQMEQGFGRDFSNVNIHTDGAAVEMNQDLRARAFTRGRDIYFNTGQYRPETSEGQRLLAHELTHVVQQGAAGSRLQREAETDPATGRPTGNYLFRRAGFYYRVRSRVADGPLTDEELIALKGDAIRRNGTVQHAELLLMAAMLRPENVALLRAHRGGDFVLPMADILPAHRDHVLNVDRGALSPEMLRLRGERDAAAEGSAERTAKEEEIRLLAEQRIQAELAGSSFAEKAIELIMVDTVPLDEILEAMINGASDSTAGDKAMAGIAYVVAKEVNHATAAHLRSGRLHVDALIPRVYRRLVGGGEAMYQYNTDQDTFKANTLYLPTSLTLLSPTHRALIFHELTHAGEDMSGPRRSENTVDLEARAYVAQGKYILDRFRAEPPHPDSDNMHQASSIAADDATHYWAYFAAAKTNVAHYEPTLRLILTSAPANKTPAEITTDLAKSAAEIDRLLRTALSAMRDSRGNPLYPPGQTTEIGGGGGHFFTP